MPTFQREETENKQLKCNVSCSEKDSVQNRKQEVEIETYLGQGGGCFFLEGCPASPCAQGTFEQSPHAPSRKMRG